jgi:hypothetical protein
MIHQFTQEAGLTRPAATGYSNQKGLLVLHGVKVSKEMKLRHGHVACECNSFPLSINIKYLCPTVPKHKTHRMKSILTSLFSLVLCATLHAQLPSYVPADGLVGWWPFNGNANDESGNGNNGVVNGATLTEDRFGNAQSAYAFDGVDDWVDVCGLSMYSEFSLSLWFRANDLTLIHPTLAYFGIEGFGFDYTTSVDVAVDNVNFSPSRLRANLNYDFGSAGTSVLNQEWNLANIQLKDSQLYFYLNGDLKEQISSSKSKLKIDSTVCSRLGCGQNSSAMVLNFFSGLLDDIAIYNRALTPSEITQLYTGAEEPVATCTPLAPNLQNGLVGYWPFCGDAKDESGNGNNGVVNGATLTEDRFGNAGSAYSFDGELDFIASNTIDSSSEISISLWANLYTLNGYPDDQTLFLRNYHPFYDIGYDQPSQRAFFGIHNGSWTKVYSPVLNKDNWFQITAVFSPGNYVKIYFNGVLSDSINTSISVLTNLGSSLFFGGEIDGPFKSIYGSIDDIAIYNRALTQEEITQLYAGNIAPCNLIASETQDTPVEVGGSAQMYVTLNATDYSMQWQTNAAGLGWMDVQDNNTYTGSQTQNLLVSNATLANHEQPFRIIVTDGICNDTSDVALLLVNNTCTAYDTITTTVEVFDTLTIENVVEVYDTLTIYNTIDIFDTTTVTVEVFDTITNVIDVFDTTTIYLQVDIFDTLFIDLYDTTYVTLTDTTYIQVIDTAYVTVTDTLLIDITFVGFEGQPSWLNTVLVYPNPTSDHITIDYGNFALMAGYNTVITDAAGATVYSSAVNTQQATIDINAWGAAGVYFMSVYDVNGTVVAVRQIVLE